MYSRLYKIYKLFSVFLKLDRKFFFLVVVAFLSCLPFIGESHFDAVSEAPRPYCLPHEPQFQTIHFASTLDGLIPSVQMYVVELVLLEQIGGVCTVAAHQQVLVKEIV